MEILKNISLKKYNTFGIDVDARYFAEASSLEDLTKCFNNGHPEILILGGGSNVLLLNNFEGLVIKNKLRGIEVTAQDDQHVYLQVGSGENWHDFVLNCVEKGYGGLENLSLIPGSVGAAPMQNIGAYGVEVKDVITSVQAFNRTTLAIEQFTNEQCKFGYRSSIFKTSHKDKYFITSVCFKLNKKPTINVSKASCQTQ